MLWNIIDILKIFSWLVQLEFIGNISYSYCYMLYLLLINKIFFRYTQGNYLGTIIYIWRISESEIIDEFQDETEKVCMLAKIHKGLPKYFTRQIRKNVLNKVLLNYFNYLSFI